MKKLFFIFFYLALTGLLLADNGVNLELEVNGLTLPQTQGGRFFLLKRIFPSATTTFFKDIEGREQAPFLESTDINGESDGRFKFFGILGQITVKTSKAAAHFRVKAGSFNTSRKSVHKVREIQRIRTPIDLSTQ